MSPEQSNPPPFAPVPPQAYGRPIASVAVAMTALAQSTGCCPRRRAGPGPAAASGGGLLGDRLDRARRDRRARGRGRPEPPNRIESPAATSSPSRRSSDSSRQRASAPKARNEAGKSWYPAPADHDPQTLGEVRRVGRAHAAADSGHQVRALAATLERGEVGRDAGECTIAAVGATQIVAVEAETERAR